MMLMKDRFDLTAHSGMHAYLKDETNKKVPGKMSYEFPDSIITMAPALKPKMYAIKTTKLIIPKLKCDEEIKKRAKGVSESCMKNVCYDNYEQILSGILQEDLISTSIRSRNQIVRTEQTDKKCMNGFDNKRYNLSFDTTLAHGNVKICDQ